ncbi:protein-disulfide reductase DsbD family protein [Bacteroidetes bacterium endosymbiont of Geopemphigus sp.]|uniref:protein-disulfide reductase DsbD family protein n=1 Tax=Bacteroidetes bacterium endosymbiont of Geopemphigus sp. TaxID=2047937 RepID=UPI0018A7F318|nr:cytochrome c biogenesis protein CcdA [Bacteroidetes bacterium endosymbiont of Geopemphigus sp.]
MYFSSLTAQIFYPVQWTSGQKKISNDEYEFLVKARIEKDWHIYSTHMKTRDIGIPVSVNFREDKTCYEKIGSLQEIGQLKQEDMNGLGGRSQFFNDKVLYKQRVRSLSSELFEIKVLLEFQACSSVNCLAPDKREFTFYINGTQKALKEPISNATERKNETSASEQKEQKARLWINIIFLGFLGGLAAVFMPCVFPMIPLTVGFFSNQSHISSESVKKALLYGISIVVIYVFLGVFMSFIFGVSALNELSTNPWINLLLFALFLLFALSFFGLFEITLPGSWANAADKKANRGGLSGLFFMAFVLVLVSFSCTAPIIGTLLVEAATQGSLLTPVMGMLGFSLGLSFPFVLFAIFPSGLKALPRSGKWLQTLKITFAFVELALAMKFLSNADLVWQGHVIEREIFLVFWIVIFLLLGLYLLGIFRLSSYDSRNLVGFPALFISIFSLSFSLYMLPGLFGAPLQLLSGFIPPRTYSEHYNNTASVSSTPFPSDAQKGPHNIPVFHDYDKGRSYAMAKLKPILLDFTGYACANCRKIEERVWADPHVKHLLSEELVVISLYVDDRKELPIAERYFSNYLNKKISTYGQKWTDFQVKHFKANAQPYCIIIDYEKQKMMDPIGVEYDMDKYIKWLESGIQYFSSCNPS